MDFTLSKKHEMARTLFKEFAEKEVKPLAQDVDENEQFPVETVAKMAKAGFLGIPVPKEYGGQGCDPLTYVMCVEELSKVCGTTGVIVSAHTSLCIDPIQTFGTEEQKKKYLVPLARGEKIGAFGLTEPNAGSDPSAMRASAVKDGDEYILNGTKTFITNGAVASVFVGFFKTNPAAGHKGISAFIIDADAPGVTVGAHENKMGLRLSNTTDLIFENVRVKASAMVGPEGSGFKLAMNALNLSRAFVATLAVGIMQRALDESVKYAKERKQFNTPIIKFQMVQQMLADMAIKIEASRCLVNNTMKMMDAGIMVQKEGSICKTFVSDCAQEVTSNAVQIFGGYGYSKEYPVEKLMRDVKVFQIFEGANQVQRLTIANVLNKEYK